MNDKFTNTPNTENTDDKAIARKLNQVAEQTHASEQFTAELEEQLRSTHRPKTGWFSLVLPQVSPTLRWVALMVLLAVVLSWSIRSLIPAPQPAVDSTPVTPDLTTSTPAPILPPDENATPVTLEGGYDFRGAKLFLQQPLPHSPDKAHLYHLQKDEPATDEEARALADRFGIQGELYTAPGIGTTDILISDGKQSIQVHSDQYFLYTSDMARNNRAYPAATNPNAEAIIREFLNTYGFDFPFRVFASVDYNGYIVQPLAPDSVPMQYESFSQPVMRVVLDEHGQVLIFDAALMSYDPTPVGEYGIISAEEALQKLLDDSVPAGKTEYVHSTGNQPREWYREYPDNQPVIVYNYLSFYPPVDPGKPALLMIRGVPVTGNTSGLESLENYTFIKATGQFILDNGIRKFNVESWDRQVQEAYLTGTLTRQGDQIVFTSDDGSGTQYTLLDPPADIPLDTDVTESQLAISGVVVNEEISWTYIQFFDNFLGGGGGGGGGGLGFYQLNLNGPPVPFPTPQPQTNSGTVTYQVQENDTLASIALNHGISVEELMQANDITINQVITGQTLIIPQTQMANDPPPASYTVQEGDTCGEIGRAFGVSIQSIIAANNLSEICLIRVGDVLVIPNSASIPAPVEQKVENLRGYLDINETAWGDGTSTREYGLEVIQESGSSLYTMDGSSLVELDAYNGLPILITGTINTLGKLVVDSYKIPYPDLQFQILRGTQRSDQLEGQNVTIFTTEEGRSYVEFLATNSFPHSYESFTGYPGDPIQQEVLIIPDETFGGMPVAHVYQSAIIQEGAPEMQVQGNQVNVYNVIVLDEPGLSNFTPPDLMIDTVELAYFANNPYYQINDPNYDQRSPYLQPVWHFSGRYTDGTAFDVLIQALEEEFLLPELAPGVTPG